MSDTIHTSISTEHLSLDRAYEFVMDDAHGAVDMFVGVVRNHHEGKAVQGMTYDVHEELAVNVFQDMCREAQNRWPDIKIYLSHYKGELAIGGVSVIIAVSASHRAETFDGCRYLIEELKKRSPIWKKEHYSEGLSEWLPGHSLSEATSG